MSKVIQGFFWSKNSNRKGINVVGWNDLIESKLEGGLVFRNLLLSKHSLMAKNLFKFLNADDVCCVDILVLKYGKYNFWRDSVPPNASVFFKGLCISADIIRPFYLMNLVNPNHTSIIFDPWCFEISLTFKPTFLNMNVHLASMNFTDLGLNGSWNLDYLANLFGDNLPHIVPRLSSLDWSAHNH